MITHENEEYILTQAYVPEHIVSLMVLISKGDPFLIGGHLGFVKDNWLIFVGYPLERDFSLERCEGILKQALESYRPEYLWFIGPEIPPTLSDSCTERESDQYYRLGIGQTKIKSSLQRMVEKASKELMVERSHSLSKDHEGLVKELLKREPLTPRVRALYLAMPEYVAGSQSSYVLNARDKKGKLSAFYVVELAAKEFATYVLGCHSKKNYIPHASDFLFFDMIKLSQEHGKKTINLGLGVSEGIRRFKEKWGGVPYLPYEFCEHYTGRTRTVSLIQSIESKL